MLHIREVVVVEGKHDAVKLAAVTDAVVFQTNGFRIFKDTARLAELRALAQKCGCVLLTDSDGAGFVIRNYLNGALPGIAVKHAFIPEIKGKEKRKSAPGKEGLLGVEGMDEETLKSALLAAGVTVDDTPQKGGFMTKARLFSDGLTGREDAAARRAAFSAHFDLPQKLSTARLIQFINAALSEEEYEAVLEELP